MKHLEITTKLPCCNNCHYCPQAVLAKAYQGEMVLSLDNFKKALTNVPKDVQIHFSAFAEPFNNPEAHEMVKYAIDSGYEVHVYTTTRGLEVDKLKDLSFGSFHVHNIGGCQNVPYATHFDTITDPISRGGHLWEITPKEGKLGCRREEAYKQNVMLPNGDVALCCMDYGLEGKLGNLLETNFENLDRTGPWKLCKTCEFSYEI